MDIIASDSWSGQIDSNRAGLCFVAYADHLSEGRGEVDVSIYLLGDHNKPDRLLGTFLLFLRDFDTVWLQRFWDLYQQDGGFRQQADAFYRLDAYRTPTDQQTIKMAGGMGEVIVDSPLANSIWALNAQGFETLASSAGGAHKKAFVTACHLPPELEEVALAAGFAVANGTIRVDVPFCQPLAMEAASEALVCMLDDWAQGELRQASAYQTYRAHIRTCSLVRFPRGVVPRKQRPVQVAKLIHKSLQGLAGVNDFAQLRSGRDAFSRMGQDDLLSALSLTSLPMSLRHREPASAKRVLRWMARGLSEGMALQKLAVDETMTERARQKSKREKALGETDSHPQE